MPLTVKVRKRMRKPDPKPIISHGLSGAGMVLLSGATKHNRQEKKAVCPSTKVPVPKGAATESVSAVSGKNRCIIHKKDFPTGKATIEAEHYPGHRPPALQDIAGSQAAYKHATGRQ